jgi:D-alanine-D-alanine ligase
LALQAFRALGCSVYGRVDVMMQSDIKQYVLEVNTIPGMTNTSLLPEAAAAAGVGFDDLVLDIVAFSLKARKAAPR